MTALKHQRPVAVCVVGVPGVGKSTLLADHVSSHPGGARHVVGSSVVKAIIAPDSVRDMDGYPVAKQSAVRAEAVRRLRMLRDEGDGPLLVDGHITLRNRVSGELELVFTPADETFYDGLVLLTSDPASVSTQREGDVRVRATERADVILAHLAAERAGAVEVARRSGIPLLVIEAQGLAERRVALAEFLMTLCPRERSVM